MTKIEKLDRQVNLMLDLAWEQGEGLQDVGKQVKKLVKDRLSPSELEEYKEYSKHLAQTDVIETKGEGLKTRYEIDKGRIDHWDKITKMIRHGRLVDTIEPCNNDKRPDINLAIIML